MSEARSAKGFEFQSLGIGAVLKGQRLKVPPYQREYAWTHEEVRQLYEDLTNAKLDGKDYFLGTIVTIHAGDASPLEIVDGQQRLTTTAIFLAAIRDHLRKLGTASLIVESINNEFLNTIDRVAGARVAKLMLNLDDNDFFSKLIAMEPPPASELKPGRSSHRLLVRAAQIARDWVRDLTKTLSEADQPARLNDWLEYIEFSATVILLKTQSGSQAFKMFETLNDRGLKTSQADLVKSYLFGQSGVRIGEAQSRWSSMRDNLEELKGDDVTINFLRHAFIATRRFVRADDVYDSTNRDIRGETSSVGFLTDLERLSRVYVATYRTDSSHWDGHPPAAAKALRVINYFDIKPMRPLILAIAMRFSEKLAAPALALLVSISVRLIIASATRSGTNEQTFASAALGVFKEDIATVGKLKEQLARVAVNDADFRETFVTARSSNSELARYYLRALEAAAANESEPWHIVNDDSSAITLEHVLPKNPPSGTWETFKDDDAADRYLKRLGNLCLLQKTPNSDMDNGDFEKKKPIFESSPLVFTNQIATFKEWSPASVEGRQKAMAEMALRAWPL
jgi:hypothetical protein